MAFQTVSTKMNSTDESWDYFYRTCLPAVKNPVDHELLKQAGAARFAFERTGTFNESTLAAWSSAAVSKSSVVRSSVFQWLFRAAATELQAVSLIRDLFRNGKATVRLSIIQSIAVSGPSLPELEREILSSGLVDASPDVRQFAGDRIETRRFRDLLPNLQSAIDKETNAKARISLERAHLMLRDGYRCNRANIDDSQIQIEVRYKQGTVGLSIPKEEVNRLGLPEIARRIRLRQDWPGARLPGKNWDPVPDPENLAIDPTIDARLLAARAAFAEFERTGIVTNDVLATLSRSLLTDSETLRECAASWLGIIAETHQTACETLLNVFTHGDEVSRRAVMRAIHQGTLRDFEIGFFPIALRDISGDIRYSAALGIQRGEYRELLPDLQNAASVETKENLRQKMTEIAALLRDGYRLGTMGTKSVSISVLGKRGVIHLCDIPRKIFDELSVSEIARRIRARGDRAGRLPGKPWDIIPPLKMD